MNRKPRLTKKVLMGIRQAIEIAYVEIDAENRETDYKDWFDWIGAADTWARKMVDYREKKEQGE